MRATILNTPVDLLTMAQTVDLILQAIQSRHKICHVAMNVAKLVKMRDDAVLRSDVLKADIIGIDGAGIVWGARILGCPVPERVAGIDLMVRMLEECAARGLKPYFLGAKPHVVAAAAERAQQRFPGLRMAGLRDGYFTSAQEEDVVAAINASGADCLFVGMPTPRKERFLAAHRPAIEAPFVMGVGGSFDVLGGTIRRAPRWMQRCGLEWSFRIMQEPRRMLWRYVDTNTRFLGLLLVALVSVRFNSVRKTAAL